MTVKSPFFHSANTTSFKVAAFSITLLLVLASVSAAETAFIEAEAFKNHGGWMVDQQFMDQMGSPFLIAHGMGTPVKDASTAMELPAGGTYRIWVRTRDWAAPWNAPESPGRFQLLVNGVPLVATFGTKDAQWRWQDGGVVDIPNKLVALALRDLTGFNGRCDAIVLTTNNNWRPPNDLEELTSFRKKMLGLSDKPQDAGRFDLVVVGGGIAGTCTAISAARLGLHVALIQNRPVLGGNNSSEVRVHLNGQINKPPYPRLGDVVAELDTGLRGNAQPAHHYDDQQKLRVVGNEERLHLFLNMHAYDVEMDGNKIKAVLAKHIETGVEYRFSAALFADCTGDGNLGFLAGADFRMGREGKAETSESLAPEEPDKMTMGASVQWYSRQTQEPSSFPDCPWAIQFSEQSCQYLTRGDWNWETGMNHDQIDDFEMIRDYGLRAVYGNWAYLKNHSEKSEQYANRELEWVAFVAGKRESRRLLGDVILQEQDVVDFRKFPDAFVTTTWTIDLHYPDPKNSRFFPGREFRSIAKHQRIKPYPIPYRSLYSRNVDNLFMAGRDISVTHVALGTIRVMRTGGMMGELVGMAASLCKKNDTTPRGVYEDHLDDLKALAIDGVGRSHDKDFAQALENGQLANEGFDRCRRFVEGWLKHADPKTGLIPRNLTRSRDIWNAQDSAADNYPFMVLIAAITDRDMFDGRMLDMLHTETKLTSRIGAMPDTYSFTKQAFAADTPNLGAIIFGSSEYIKDGLLPLTEWLGHSPWSQRMIAILDDIWANAPVETPFGNIPSTSQEVNGEMLQTLSRVYWMTGEKKYLDWAIRLGDYYLLANHHPTRDETRLRLRDHGCEIVSGLCELYATTSFAMPEKKKVYRRPIHNMLDRILEVGTNQHGMFYNSVNPGTGEHDKAMADTWGYNLNGFYTVYLIDDVDAYRAAAVKALGNLFDSYRAYNWEGGSSDGYADSIESALNLYNRQPVPSAARWIDSETQNMWAIQKPDGVIEGWHGDGNFARTTIMYCLWKTQGLTIRPWRKDVIFGAVRAANTLKVTLRADKPWKGTLIFDTPRHKTVMKMPLDWPRINQFPEWFTVEADRKYTITDRRPKAGHDHTGEQLAEGIPIQLQGAVEMQLLVQ